VFNISGPVLQDKDLGSYLTMRMTVPKPPAEERHARHIQRYYACRGLHKLGYTEIFVRPDVAAPSGPFHPDVVGRSDDRTLFVYCATYSLDELPRDEIQRLLAGPEQPLVMIIAANTLDIPALGREFADQSAAGQISVRVMTLPPFDDVLEYDIWMFELTFQEVGA
jgi:hypothetical protein